MNRGGSFCFLKRRYKKIPFKSRRLFNFLISVQADQIWYYRNFLLRSQGTRGTCTANADYGQITVLLCTLSTCRSILILILLVHNARLVGFDSCTRTVFIHTVFTVIIIIILDL